ncbi:methyltransferase domain-containing protein [Kitasatospora griseola]|uniref:methyltransferase domain-containing protein n=1 Tax=Kitasatospora griseola TaxID=2064 RepID=UPI00382C8F50
MSIETGPDAASRESARLLALLDAVDSTPESAALRARSFDLLAVGPGTRLVDVGCGGGLAVAEAARLGAEAVGVDADPRMVAAARQRWPGGTFTVGDACALPFADGSLTAYRADKVYHELPDPAAAAAEAHRVLAPGGHIALLGQDWDALIVDADDAELTRALVRARAARIPHPRVARRIRNLLLDAGFREVRVEVRTEVFTDGTALRMLTGLAAALPRADPGTGAGSDTGPDVERWLAEQRHRAAEGRAFVAVPIVLAAGVR